MKKNKHLIGIFVFVLLITINEVHVNAENVNYIEPSIKAQFLCYPYEGFQFSQEWYDGIEDGMQVFHINYVNDSNTVIFYYHGGNFINNPLDEHWQFFNYLADFSDAEIIVPIYPMSYFQDSEDRYLMLIIEYINFKLENPDKRVVFVGDSAGGNLAVGVSERLRDLKIQLPDKLVLISPWTDLTDNSSVYSGHADPGTQQYFQVTSLMYAGALPRTDGRISVSYSDLSGLPDTMVMAGALDFLFPDIAKFSDSLEAFGVNVTRHYNPYLAHSYPIMYNLYCINDIRAISEFIK